ncbi:MAG: LLM class flavin-dependent oxidoreductase [Betaproteobacteria bacterium]|nr:LLM class flavin-dependent oxidoreductase [Betaproteobacteria bacterium]
MTPGFALSVLDQSPVISGGSPAAAIHATIELAIAAERLGYKRYWLAEHHGLAGLADPCPEILLTRVAAATRTLRVGTGGIMLPYYSAFKVAEVFRMLETLFPGRIDLGVGRAPGGDLRTAQAMTSGEYRGAPEFPGQIQDVIGYLSGALPDGHPYQDVLVQPAGAAAPEFWVLGSSDYGGALAAALGLRFTFAHFITAQGGDAVTRAYRQQFRPSAALRAPQAMAAVFVLCAETDAEAERLAAAIDLRRLQMDQGINGPIPTLAEAAAWRYTEADRLRIRQHRQRAVIGSPARVREQLLVLRERYAADELVVVTITGDYASRLRSYELLAEAFGLAGPAA